MLLSLTFHGHFHSLYLLYTERKETDDISTQSSGTHSTRSLTFVCSGSNLSTNRVIVAFLSPAIAAAEAAAGDHYDDHYHNESSTSTNGWQQPRHGRHNVWCGCGHGWSFACKKRNVYSNHILRGLQIDTLTSSEVDSFTAGSIPSIVDCPRLETVGSPRTEVADLCPDSLPWCVEPTVVPCHHLWLRELKNNVNEWGRPLFREFDIKYNRCI